MQHDPRNQIMSNAKNLWEEFVVKAVNEELGFEIPLCGLCGNSGILDTTTSAKWSNKSVGIKAYCICPNGRARKKVITKQKKWEGSSVLQPNGSKNA